MAGAMLIRGTASVAGKIILRDYQERLAQRVLDLLSEGHREVCLAAAPSAGKTQTSIDVIRRCVDADKRVLVLTHGTITLRDNFVERLKKYDVGFDWHEWKGRRAQAAYDQIKAPVIVTIPHSFRALNPGTFDLVVVDEAHQFYEAKMVQDILARVGKPKVLLLTGTPSLFVARKVPMASISAAELLELGMLADPLIELGTSAYDFTYDQYNDQGELMESTSFRAAQTQKTMDDLLEALVKRLEFQSNLDKGWTDLNQEKYRAKAGWTWKGQIKKIGKTMISCRSIEQANQVETYFKRKGVEVLVSHSDNDPDSLMMKQFKKDPNALVLVVVYRGTLGYDCEDMANAVDLTGSINVDRIFQFMCRVVRLSTKMSNKLFVKMSPKGMAEYTEVIMSLVCQLGASKDFYEKWDGRMRSDLPVRMRQRHERADHEPREKSMKKPGKVAPIPVPDELVLFRSWQGLLHDHDEDYAGYVWTTLGKAREKLLGVAIPDPEGRKALIRKYYEENGKLPDGKHPLVGAMRNYCSPASESFDPAFRSWCVERGLGRTTRISDLEAREWVRRNVPDFQPGKAAYPGTAHRWPGVHVPCGAKVAPKLGQLRIGIGACGRCARAMVAQARLGKKCRKTTSIYVGVTLRRDGKKWLASFRNKFLGSYDAEEEAARAYDKAAREHVGADAKLNFPNE